MRTRRGVGLVRATVAGARSKNRSASCPAQWKPQTAGLHRQRLCRDVTVWRFLAGCTWSAPSQLEQDSTLGASTAARNCIVIPTHLQGDSGVTPSRAPCQLLLPLLLGTLCWLLNSAAAGSRCLQLTPA